MYPKRNVLYFVSSNYQKTLFAIKLSSFHIPEFETPQPIWQSHRTWESMENINNVQCEVSIMFNMYWIYLLHKNCISWITISFLYILGKHKYDFRFLTNRSNRSFWCVSYIYYFIQSSNLLLYGSSMSVLTTQKSKIYTLFAVHRAELVECSRYIFGFLGKF